jgi:hypothetical protein
MGAKAEVEANPLQCLRDFDQWERYSSASSSGATSRKRR